jgi:hypothetical protein
MFDYAYFHPDNGVFPQLSSTMNETMSNEYQNSSYNNSMMLKQAFGVGRFVVLGLSIVFFILSIVDFAVYRRPGG